ncbi:Peptide methionine sulfoxide reductase A4 [Hibiscus syriacus]|uniref:peptide-methionine (S)-S-oxide reductase n=1 Tax=Hibiscus syriacus TaxID=106335 RepID=A0A6A3B8X5_HIBSY|nr:peptide methionine sulfoxide reductase A1-like [Hibiscus syriacus]KAE8711855.1 Peptide methionine sulfoxide reductase A4 [Hibiscus syriacus]
MLRSLTLVTSSSLISNPLFSLSPKFPNSFSHLYFPFPQTKRSISLHTRPMNILKNLGFGANSKPAPSMEDSSIAQGPDEDVPAPGQQFAQFGAGCFWGVELTFQRVPGVTKTEVGYSQGFMHNPSYEDVCSGTTNHNEVVRVQYDPKECNFDTLLDVFWDFHDPTTPNRQGNDVGTQYRSGIYFYTPEQEMAARESMEKRQKLLNRKIVTEILPAKKFYRAEEYHQQYLAKGGRFGFKQSAEKGCNDPIRCYG